MDASGHLMISGSDLVYEKKDSQTKIIIVNGEPKRCLAYGTIAGGLIVLLREGVDGALDGVVDSSNNKKDKKGARESKKSGKTSNGTPVSSQTKRTLSVFSFDSSTFDIHFHTHVSVDGWSSLITNPHSSFVVLSDYTTAHSEVLEWMGGSKTLRRVWEGRGSCPHHFNYHISTGSESKGTNGEAGHPCSILLLLYSARKFSLCNAKTMKEVAECSARSRELDIIDVIAANDDGYALVVYENGASSVFEVSETEVKRLADLGKILEGEKPTHVISLPTNGHKKGLDESSGEISDEPASEAKVTQRQSFLIFSETSNVACLLHSDLSSRKKIFSKSQVRKDEYKEEIESFLLEKGSQSGKSSTKSSKKKSKDSDKKEKSEEKKKRENVKEVAQTPAREESPGLVNTVEISATTVDARTTDTVDDDEDTSEGGIGLSTLVLIAGACVALTAVLVLKVASK